MRDDKQNALYTPIGCHYGHYCVAYNAYALCGENDGYDEKLDPWSAKFMYRTKSEEMMCYRNVVQTTL